MPKKQGHNERSSKIMKSWAPNRHELQASEAPSFQRNRVTVDSSTVAQLPRNLWMSSDVQPGTRRLRQTWNRHNSLQSQEQQGCGSSELYLLGYVPKMTSFVKQKSPSDCMRERPIQNECHVGHTKRSSVEWGFDKFLDTFTREVLLGIIVSIRYNASLAMYCCNLLQLLCTTN